MLGRWVHTSPAQQLVAGPGAADALGDLLRQLGVRRALVVTTPGRASSDGVVRMLSRATRAIAATADVVEPGVSTAVVQRLIAQLRSEGVDGLVSVGGGSATDTAKAVAFFAEHESGAPGAGFADRPVLPHVAVATTLVGAPFSSSFSMVDPASRRSTSTGGPTMTPSAVVLDADLGADLTADHLAQSAAVAAAHAIEAAWSSESTPEARALGLAGLAGLAAAVPDAVAEPGDVGRRGPVVDAAVLCGRARQNTADGLQQALAQLIGARGAATHAAAHAALLPVTTRFLADAVADDQVAAVAAALGAPDAGAEAVVGFVERIGATVGLSQLGLTDDDLDAVARQSSAQRGVQTSLRPVGEADIRAVLDDAW